MPTETFAEYLAGSGPTVDVQVFLFDLLLAGLLCFILGKTYVHYGRSLSNRAVFAQNFLLIGLTTTLVIAVVKSSLALSLGLVGALSIVRFRTPIKEPEELAYLFLTIAIGLGLGANQRLLTVVSFCVIFGVVWVSHKFREDARESNLYITVNANTKELELQQIVETLQRSCGAVELKRFDEADGLLEASFLVNFESFAKLNESKTALQSIGKSVKITFVDNAGIF